MERTLRPDVYFLGKKLYNHQWVGRQSEVGVFSLLS